MLDALLAYVRESGTVVLTKLDRMGLSRILTTIRTDRAFIIVAFICALPAAVKDIA
jgi:hypothetical protein